MRRRDFIRAIAGSVLAWPLTSHAQQSAIPVIGYLGGETPERFATRLRAFREGLSATGFEEGRNVTIDSAGLTVKSTDCRRSRPILFSGRFP